MARVLHVKITNVVLTSPEQFARESKQRVQRYRKKAEQTSYWRAHPKEKQQQMNTLLTFALLALFVGHKIGKD
jgi:hypothetical protein